MCEANSITSIESDSTMCYDESNNDSISSGPMFIQDTNDTDTDDELPECKVQPHYALLGYPFCNMAAHT